MKPDSTFIDLDVQAYVELLEVRLREFNQPDEARQLAAMDLFDRTIMQWTPAQQWLGWFFDGLLPAVQVRFQHAIAELLGRVRPNRFPPQALHELIALAADIQAEVAVPAMLRLVADGGDWSHKAPGTMACVMAALKRLKPAGLTHGHVCRLVASPAFEVRLVFDAFELLVRARPDAWAEAWLLLSCKFDRAWHLASSAGSDLTEPWFERRMRDVARRCLSALSPWTVVEGTNALGEALGMQLYARLDRHQPLGMLWHELVCRADSPFEKRDGEATNPWCRVCRRGDLQDDGVPWPENWIEWDAQWLLLSRPWLDHRGQVCRLAELVQVEEPLRSLIQTIASQNQDLYREPALA